MSWNALNTIKNKKPAGGGITLAFDNMTGVTTNIVPGWTVYTISSDTALTKTITATVSSTTTINILMAGGGGGGYRQFNSPIGGGGGGRFLEISKSINSTIPTQTFTCTLPAKSTGKQVGGTTHLTFSDPLVGNISCGGGGYGTNDGARNNDAPAGGGSGGGGGGSNGSGLRGGTGIFGFDGGSGSWNSTNSSSSGGGGGGAGGIGGRGHDNGITSGSGGIGKSATLAGITSVYPTLRFCSGGGVVTGSSYGGGAQGNVNTSTTGNPGVIIIAVPT